MNYTTSHILNNITKTFITIIISVICGVLIGNIGLHYPFDVIFGLGSGIFVFWVLCPHATKEWIKNWTKPSEEPIITNKTDEQIADLQNEIKNLSLTLFDILRPDVLTNRDHKQIDELMERAVGLWLPRKGGSVSLLDALLVAHDNMQTTKEKGTTK